MRGLKILLPALLLVLLVGCAPEKAPVKVDIPDTPLEIKEASHEGPVTLSYMMKGRELRYASDNDFVQGIGLPTGVMELKAVENTVYTVRAEKGGEMDCRLRVTIDAKETWIQTPPGKIEPDMAGIIGREFQVDMDRLGREGEIEADEELTYTIGTTTRNAAQSFQAFFPDLAEGSVNVGDSWKTHEVLDESDTSNDITITLDTVNTLDGFVEIAGMLCARVATTFTGMLEGKGEEQGTPLDIAMDLEGSGHWYFAVEAGIYVMQASEGRGKGSIKVQGNEMPLSRDFSSEVRLVP